MNSGLLAGLGGFLNSIGTNITKERDEDRQDQRAERKAQLAYKMQMDLLKAKQEYAKANPTYQHFINTSVGDVMAFDQFGNAKLISGTDEMKQSAKEKADAINALKQGQAEEASARLGLIGAQTEAAKARASRDNRYVPGAGKAPPRDPHILPPLKWKEAVNGLIKEYNDPNAPYTPDDAEYGALKSKAEAQLKQMGYTQGFQKTAAAPTGLVGGNVFANLIPQAGGEEEATEEESDDEDVINY